MLEHIGKKGDELRSEIGEYNSADGCKFRAGVDFKLAALSAASRATCSAERAAVPSFIIEAFRRDNQTWPADSLTAPALTNARIATFGTTP
jgi:hypothetical protein